MIIPRVVKRKGLRKVRPLTVADRRTIRQVKQCYVVVRLQGHYFGGFALIMPKLDKFDVDCQIGQESIDHMGGVRVRI